jgi:hypothetical protein
MIDFFTSYKKTSGYKIFGRDWQLIHELNLELLELLHTEKLLIRRIVHIGHKISLQECDDREGYVLIIQDLQARLLSHMKERELQERVVAVAFDELCEKRKIFMTSLS